MTTKSTFSISFLARGIKRNPTNCNIYVRITVNNRRSEFVIIKTVLKEAWNPVKERINSKYLDFKKSNSYIDQVRSSITNSYRELTLNNEFISPAILKNKFLGIAEEGQTLMDLMKYHNTSQKSVLAEGTLKNYYTTERYIVKFLKEKKSLDDISLRHLNYKFISEFETFLRAYVPTDHQRPLNNNGVMKHLERLKKVTNMAVKFEWLEKDPFERYKLVFHKTDKGYLTELELKSIITKTIHIPRIDFVRDLFVFACYTGMAYVDVQKLKPDNIVIGIDGGSWIHTKRKKTNILVQMPLLPVSEKIINKYRNDPRSLGRGKIFPMISNQKINSYLKEIADICGINKNLTFHIARHTFATTVTLSNGVPIETVSKVLGHTKLSTTMIYARVLKNKISEDMNNLKATL